MSQAATKPDYRTQILFCAVHQSNGAREVYEGEDATEVFAVIWDARMKQLPWTMPASLEDGREKLFNMNHIVDLEFEPEAAAAKDKTF